MTNKNQNEIEKELIDEIESQRALLQTYLASDMDIDKMPSSEILEFAMQEDDRIRDDFLIHWKDYAFLRGKSLGSQSKQKDILRILDEIDTDYIYDWINGNDEVFEKDYDDDELLIKFLDKIKQELKKGIE